LRERERERERERVRDNWAYWIPNFLGSHTGLCGGQYWALTFLSVDRASVEFIKSHTCD